MTPLQKLRLVRDAVSHAISKYRTDLTIEDLIQGVDIQDRQVYRTLLTNQLEWCDHSQLTPTQQQLLMTIAKKTVDGLISARAIVGIQPTKGPCASVFRLRQSPHPDDPTNDHRRVLSVVSSTVTADSSEFEAHPTIDMVDTITTSKHGATIIQAVAGVLSTELVHTIVNTVVSSAQASARYYGRDATHIAQHLSQLALNIQRSSRRGRGNVVVTSPVGAALLRRSSSVFTPCDVPSFVEAAPIQLVGHLKLNDADIVPVYVSLASELGNASATAVFLMAYKCDSDVDVGMVYCPYIPVAPRPVTLDPVTFQPVTRWYSRHAMCADDVHSNYYAKLTVVASSTEDKPNVV
jgi:hypothetical protein